MSNGWDRFEKRAEKGPLSLFFWFVGFMLVVIVTCGLIGYGFGWFGEAATVAKQQFGPKAGLQKYEWFKSAAAQLAAKRQDIENHRASLADTEKTYGAPATWPRDVREDYSQRKDEVTGLITAYNGLVAEYQAASSKFNWQPFESTADRPPLVFEEYKQQ